MRLPKPKIRGKRADKIANPKLRYTVRRKIPTPALQAPEGNSILNDEQLAMLSYSSCVGAEIHNLPDEQLKTQ